MTGHAASTGEPFRSAVWSVAVATSGGLVGVGRGGVVVESTGKLMVSDPMRLGRPVVPREARLSTAEMRRISAAVEECRPAGWKSPKPKQAALDAFAYVLELRRGVEIHQAAWHDNTRNDLPADLTELYASLETAWSRVSENRD